MNPSDTMQFRESREPGHFWADNEILMRYGRELGAYGVAVYVVFCMTAQNHTAKCEITCRQVANILGISKTQAAVAVNKLIDLKLAVQEYQSKGPSEGPSRYRLAAVPKMSKTEVSWFWGSQRSKSKSTVRNTDGSVPDTDGTVRNTDGSVPDTDSSVRYTDGTVRDTDTNIDSYKTLQDSYKTVAALPTKDASGFKAALEGVRMSKGEQLGLESRPEQRSLTVPVPLVAAGAGFNDVEVAKAMCVELGLAGHENIFLLAAAIKNFLDKNPGKSYEEAGETMLSLYREYQSVNIEFKRGWRKFFAEGIFLRREDWGDKPKAGAGVTSASALVEERRKKIEGGKKK